MADRLVYLIREWAEAAAEDMWKSGYPGINAVEQLLRDPGRSLGINGHRVLYFHRNQRIAKVSRAMHQVDPISQVCLIVKYGRIVDDDGRIMTGRDLVSNSSLTPADYKEKCRSALHKLRKVLNLG